MFSALCSGSRGSGGKQTSNRHLPGEGVGVRLQVENATDWNEDTTMTPYEAMGLIMTTCKEHKLRPRWKKAFAFCVYKQARNLMKGTLTAKQVHAALRYHVKSVQYLRRLKEGAQRYDLYGQPCGKVTAEEAIAARKELFEHHGGAMRDGRKRMGKVLVAQPSSGRHKRPASLATQQKPSQPAEAGKVESKDGSSVEGGGNRLSLKLGKKPGG
jgi:hypothetical protein